jgi:NAD(P)H-hydrate epimerase
MSIDSFVALAIMCSMIKLYSPDQQFIVMSREQVRAFDHWAINSAGVPGTVLMENAGRSCAELILEKFQGAAHTKVTIFCGTGNNGGDGYVIARHLFNAGWDVNVLIFGDKNKIKGDARINLDILKAVGHKVHYINMSSEDMPQAIRDYSNNSQVLVDAIFGTGLQGPLRSDYAVLVDVINGLQIPVVAVDIPSGLDCDTGEPLGAAIKAVFTITFAAIKLGFTAAIDCSSYTGRIYLASIGIDPDAMTSD